MPPRRLGIRASHAAFLDRLPLFLGPRDRQLARRSRRVEPRIEPTRDQQFFVLENLALDAIHLAVIAQFEQIAIVADEEFEQLLAGLRLPWCVRLVRAQKGGSSAIERTRYELRKRALCAAFVVVVQIHR